MYIRTVWHAGRIPSRRYGCPPRMQALNVWRRGCARLALSQAAPSSRSSGLGSTAVIRLRCLSSAPQSKRPSAETVRQLADSAKIQEKMWSVFVPEQGIRFGDKCARSSTATHALLTRGMTHLLLPCP